MSYKWGLNRGGDGCLKKASGNMFIPQIMHHLI